MQNWRGQWSSFSRSQNEEGREHSTCSPHSALYGSGAVDKLTLLVAQALPRGGVRLCYIYLLRDPRDRAVRYVGSTLSLKERRKVHCAALGASAKEVWVHTLREVGLEPVMEVITTCKPNQRYLHEEHYVSQLRSAGHDLLNEKKVPLHFRSAQTRNRVRMELIAGVYELVTEVRNNLYTVQVPSGAVYSVYGGLHTRSKYYYVYVNEHKYHVPRSVWIYKSPPDERYFHKSPWMCGREDRKAKVV